MLSGMHSLSNVCLKEHWNKLPPMGSVVRDLSMRSHGGVTIAIEELAPNESISVRISVFVLYFV